MVAENSFQTFSDSGHLSNKRCISTEQNPSDIDSKDTSIFDFSNNHPSSFCSLYQHHDTTNFFYRPYSSKIMTDVNDSVAVHKKRYRTNLRNSELSKHTFRIFLEKQILSHVEIEIQKNTEEPQTPLTPNFNFDESNLASSKIRLTLSPFQTAISEEKSSIKNNLILPNLEAKMCSSNGAIKITNAIVNHNDSKINVFDNPIQNKSKVFTYTAPASNQNTAHPKMDPAVIKQSNYASIYANSPEWFEDNETVSVHGSLLSETISDISANSDLKKNTNRKRYRWKRILFCCVN